MHEHHSIKKKLYLPYMYMTLGVGIMIFLSWLKFYFTNNILVDHNPFPHHLGYLVFGLFLLGIIIYSLGYFKIYQTLHHFSKEKKYKYLAYILVVFSSMMLPFVSNDVIIYLAHGQLSNVGVDVFGNTNILKDSIWAPHIFDWIDGPFVYGPINLVPAKIANYIGGDNLIVTFIVYKIMMIGFSILIIELVYKYCRNISDFILVIFNPAFWLHNVGHMHNDIIACAMILVAFYFLFKQNNIVLSSIFIAIAMLSKVSVVVYVPFIYVFYFLFSNIPKTFNFILTALGLFSFLTTLFFIYFLFWNGGTTLTVPFGYLDNQLPNKSFAEILGEILNVIFSSNVIDEINSEFIHDHNPKVKWWRITIDIFHGIGILLTAITTFIFVYKSKWRFTKLLVAEYFTKVCFIFFFFYLHIFQAWYLILIFPFIILLKNNDRIKKYYAVLCCYSGIHTIMITIDRPSYLFYLLPILVVGNIILFLWQFRKNYLTVETVLN